MPLELELITGRPPALQRSAGTSQLPSTLGEPESVTTSATVASAPAVPLARWLAPTTVEARLDAESPNPTPAHCTWLPILHRLSHHRECAVVDVELHRVEHRLGRVGRLLDGGGLGL